MPCRLPLPLQDTSQRGHVEVQGLRAETRFISGGLHALLRSFRCRAVAGQPVS